MAGRFASLWKNGGAHLSGEAAGKTGPKSVNCGEILPNSYGLEQTGVCGTQVIVLLGMDNSSSSEEHPSEVGPGRQFCGTPMQKEPSDKQNAVAVRILFFAKRFFDLGNDFFD
jgi:hypothetical protein